MNDPKRRPLGPAAQKVRDAVLATYADNVPRDENLWALERPSTVAACRALLDQVVPEDSSECAEFTNEAIRLNRMSIRAKTLAIAAELEGHHG